MMSSNNWVPISSRGGHHPRNSPHSTRPFRKSEHIPFHYKWLIPAELFAKWFDGTNGFHMKSPIFGPDGIKFRLHLTYNKTKNMDMVSLELVNPHATGSTGALNCHGDNATSSDVSVTYRLQSYGSSTMSEKPITISYGRSQVVWTTDFVFPRADVNKDKMIRCELNIIKSASVKMNQNMDWSVVEDTPTQQEPFPTPPNYSDISSPMPTSASPLPPPSESSTANLTFEDGQDDNASTANNDDGEEDEQVENVHIDGEHVESDYVDDNHVEEDHTEKDHVEVIHTKAGGNASTINSLVVSSHANGSNINVATIQDQQTILFSQIASLRSNPLFADVTFVVGGREFPAHKNILSVRSQVFKALFTAEDKTSTESTNSLIEIDNVDADVFDVLLNFIYKGDISSVDRYAAQLLMLASKYDIDSLVQVCDQHIADDINVESACKILAAADQQGLSDLKAKVIQFITDHVTEVIATDGWKEIIKPNAGLLAQLFERLAFQ